MMPEQEHTGGCLCGAIRYRVNGAPTETNLCYCTQCQRQTGAAAPAFATFPLVRFALLQGQPATYRSSAFALRQFCPSCGSALFWRRDGSDQLDVFFGTLDDPGAMPPPRDQIWTSRRVPWLLDLHRIPSHREGRPAQAD